MESTPHPCPPSSSGGCFHARHNALGTVVWTDGHVKAERPARFERAPGIMALMLQFGLGDIDRDGDPRTSELWDLE
jgi:prepilin-type processing-associated H-X9-DG protein